jgi:hypothetical protein
MRRATYSCVLMLLALTACNCSRDVGDNAARREVGTAHSYTVEERLEQYGAAVEGRLRDRFVDAGVEYPPRSLAYLAFKDARRLEVYARNTDTEPWRFVTEYAVLAASGSPGPKLRQGDRQVPEGFYRAALLNPNSRFHLSIGLDYPNELDCAIAQQEGRASLGGDIMIHGNEVSIGCLAMGDSAAEDLFILAALAGREHLRVIIAPTDFRVRPVSAVREERAWVQRLYEGIRDSLVGYPSPAVPAGREGDER